MRRTSAGLKESTSTLYVSCPLVPPLFMPLSARFLPAISFWLALLLLMRPCLLVNVCLLLVWYTVAWALSRCRPRPVLPGVAPPSAPSGVLRPKPLRGKAWSPSCFFLFMVICATITSSHTVILTHSFLPCVFQTPKRDLDCARPEAKHAPAFKSEMLRSISL
jgi:hypothetical protein